MSSVIIAGNTSGTITLDAPNVAGTTTLTLPTTSGTIALTASPTFTGQATIPTINLTGGQITFPATQSASADANTLDDYEEGTWTPIYTQTTTNPTVSYASTAGFYRKIGSFVYVSGRISTDSVAGGSGNIRIGGLPFTSANLSQDNGSFNVGVSFGWPANTFPSAGFQNRGTALIQIVTANSSDARSGVDIQLTSFASGSGANGIVFSCCYIASA